MGINMMDTLNGKVKDLYELQLRQLSRLLQTKKLNFRESYYVVFSDYPTKEDLLLILRNCEENMLGVEIGLYHRILKERDKLIHPPMPKSFAKEFKKHCKEDDKI